MATELLSIGTSTTPSVDFTVASGTQKTLVIKGNSVESKFPNAQIYLQIKDDSNNYWTVETLNGIHSSFILMSPGTYRLLRKAGGLPAGVFSE